MSRAKATDRASVFVRGALKKQLITRRQAEECLGIARKMQRRGRDIAIEDVFVRKGYLSKAEARSIAKRLRPAHEPAAAPKSTALALVEEEDTSCPNCGKNPGHGDDCFRCGTDLETGGPGPRATLCDACGRVVLRGTAICPQCAQPIGRRSRRPERRGRSVVLDRLILFATVLGMGYFLVYRSLIAPPAQPVEPPPDAAVKSDASPLVQAQQALEKGQREQAVGILEKALNALDENDDATRGQRLALQRALALTAPPRLARRAAKAVLSQGDDPLVRLQLARLAMRANKPQEAVEQLKQVGAKARDDVYWRLRARAERAGDGGKAGAWVTSLGNVETLTPPERRRLAVELSLRGRELLSQGHLKQAELDLRRACQLRPGLQSARVSLGMLLLRQKKPGEARRAFEAAIRSDPRHAAPYLGLGMALEQLSEGKRAIELYKEFVRIARAEQGQEARIKQVEARIRKLSR